MIFLLIGCKEQDDVRMHSYKPVDNGLVVSLDMAIDAATYFLYMTDNQIQTRFHMNWGWGSNYNGWFIPRTTYSQNGYTFGGITVLHVLP